MLLQQLFDKIFFKFFVSLIASLIQQYCGAPTNTPLPQPAEPNFGDALIRHCLPRFKKYAENVTIYLQCLNRLNGKDVAVLGKQVLMFDEKKI